MTKNPPSALLTLVCRKAQGSILGPLLFILLFILYINDLPNILHSNHCVLYADDTTISCSGNSLVSVTSKLNDCLASITNWCNDNCLIINAAKTHYMLFHSSHKHLPNPPSLTLGPHQISVCEGVTFLGVILDSNLKFVFHINHIKKKCAFGIRALIKARPFFSFNALMSLYFAFIHSHISYGIAAWGNTYQCHLSSIQHIQNQAIRIITSSPFRSNASVLLHEHNILCVQKLFHYNLSLLFFKLLSAQLPISFIDSVFLLNPNCTRFAFNRNLLLPLVNSNYGKQTSHFAAVSFWNSLPPTVKSATHLSSSKKSVNKFLLT